MITFLGDAGIDHYIELNKKLLGGCALNAATHYARNSGLTANLIYPSSLDDQTIESHCKHEGINTVALRRKGKLPCQEITISSVGEKQFLNYHSGILENFILTENEIEIVAQIDGIIVAPLFKQTFPLIDQVVAVNTKASFYFDFHDCSDFEYDIEKISNYLEKCSFAQFGLSPRSMHLKEDLIASGKNILLTQGAEQIYCYMNSKESVYTPKRVAAVIDSTGAGDAFLGAFLALNSLEQASDYAATVLTRIGSI